MDGFDGMAGNVRPAATPPAPETVVQYVFPVEIEVRSVGAEVHKDDLVEAALASLVEELSAL